MRNISNGIEFIVMMLSALKTEGAHNPQKMKQNS